MARLFATKHAVMSRESLLEGLRDLERSEKPGTVAAQLREVKDEINALLAKGYTQKQIWSALNGRGLTLTFSGFKTFLYRMQENVVRLQKASKSFVICPRCGAEVNGGARSGNEGNGAQIPADSQSAGVVQGAFSDENASGESMGAAFAHRLQDGSINRGLLPKRSAEQNDPVRAQTAYRSCELHTSQISQ